jgi:hypothetical protein
MLKKTLTTVALLATLARPAMAVPRTIDIQLEQRNVLTSEKVYASL